MCASGWLWNGYVLRIVRFIVFGSFGASAAVLWIHWPPAPLHRIEWACIITWYLVLFALNCDRFASTNINFAGRLTRFIFVHTSPWNTWRNNEKYYFRLSLHLHNEYTEPLHFIGISIKIYFWIMHSQLELKLTRWKMRCRSFSLLLRGTRPGEHSVDILRLIRAIDKCTVHFALKHIFKQSTNFACDRLALLTQQIQKAYPSNLGLDLEIYMVLASIISWIRQGASARARPSFQK